MLNAHIDDVRTFVAVVEAGSVSAAARDLHLTQSAVTRRVQRFEQALGTRLIDRRRRPFALTAEGAGAVERCRRMMAAVADLAGSVRAAAGPAGDIRLGVAHALSEATLLEPIEIVQKAWPAVSWRLRTGWSQDLIARVQQGALDAACVLLPARDALPGGVQGERLASEDLLIVAARGATARRFRRPRDLADAAWVLNPEGCAARAQLQRLLGRARLPFRVAIETYDYELQMSLVARQRGLGLVPRRLLQGSRSKARLEALEIGGLVFPFAVWMVRQDMDDRLAEPVGALCEALRSRNRR